jgi:hypothetical protein
MDALIEETAKPKRRSGYERQKIRNAFLIKDVAALENLVETLLGHLERAIHPDITDNDRNRYRHMVLNIRATLNNE